MMQTVAEGWWCTRCEFFEQDDEINETVEQCIACGCAGSDHTRVEIVSKTWEFNEVAFPEVEVDERALRESLNRMEKEA